MNVFPSANRCLSRRSPETGILPKSSLILLIHCPFLADLLWHGSTRVNFSRNIFSYRVLITEMAQRFPVPAHPATSTKQLGTDPWAPRTRKDHNVFKKQMLLDEKNDYWSSSSGSVNRAGKMIVVVNSRTILSRMKRNPFVTTVSDRLRRANNKRIHLLMMNGLMMVFRAHAGGRCIEATFDIRFAKPAIVVSKSKQASEQASERASQTTSQQQEERVNSGADGGAMPRRGIACLVVNGFRGDNLLANAFLFISTQPVFC